MATGLVTPVNIRDATVTKSNEPITVPSTSPYKARLLEVPSQADGVKLRRITAAVKTGGGPSTMVSSGYYVGLTSKSMRVEITKAGAVGVAEFKWSDTGGTTWNGTNIPISDTDPFPLLLGIEVAFDDTGGDFVLGERWDFEAQYWTEMTTVPIATKTFLVNYANGAITFYSGDVGIMLYAGYEGRGSVVNAEDVSQLITTLDIGELVIRNLDTSGFATPKFLHMNSSGAKELADASSSKPAFGCSKVIDALEGEITIYGVVGGFSSLTPGAVYYLAEDGAISITPASFIQAVGRALSTTQLLVNPFLEADTMCYGEMYADNVTQVVDIVTKDVFVQIPGGFTGGLTKGFTFQNSKELKCLVPGTYSINWSLSIQAGTTITEVEGAVMKNGTAQSKGTAHSEVSIGGINRPECIGGTLILILAVNDLVSLAVENHTDMSDVTMHHGNLTLNRIG